MNKLLLTKLITTSVVVCVGLGTAHAQTAQKQIPAPANQGSTQSGTVGFARPVTPPQTSRDSVPYLFGPDPLFGGNYTDDNHFFEPSDIDGWPTWVPIQPPPKINSPFRAYTQACQEAAAKLFESYKKAIKKRCSEIKNKSDAVAWCERQKENQQIIAAEFIPYFKGKCFPKNPPLRWNKGDLYNDMDLQYQIIIKRLIEEAKRKGGSFP